jgi:cytosine/adenosine deaminase-related metal-dependent hydrolase
VTVYRSSWVVPIVSAPIRDGWVAVEDGVIADLGEGRPAPGAVDLGDVILLPALVNAHTHLELSYLRGAIAPSSLLVEWIRQVMAARRRMADPRDPGIIDAARLAIGDALRTGTGLIGDISNTLVAVPLLREARMPSRVFYELLGFNTADPLGQVRRARAEADEAAGGDAVVSVSIAPHAPYSVSPDLFAAIRADLDAHPGDVSSIHLAESADEVELVAAGTGRWRTLLSDVGAWNDSWRPPGVSPVRYLGNLGFLTSRVLAVHAVQCSAGDLLLLRTRGTPVVSCPRSNRYVGVGSPPLTAFYEAGLTVAFGTDSLASVEDLNLFSELAEARRIAPSIAAGRLLASATLHGARALGAGDRFGSIERGKQGALVAVQTPGAIDDVEEYLVSGVEPEAIERIG